MREQANYQIEILINQHVDTLNLGTVQPEFEPPKHKHSLTGHQANYENETMKNQRTEALRGYESRDANSTDGPWERERFLARLGLEELDGEKTGSDIYMTDEGLYKFKKEGIKDIGGQGSSSTGFAENDKSKASTNAESSGETISI